MGGSAYSPDMDEAFMDEIDFSDGERSLDWLKDTIRINNLIEEWHENDEDIAIHEFLGMSFEEYKNFVENKSQ